MSIEWGGFDRGLLDPNLYTCRRCGWTTDVGNDDLAGDEDVVRQRIAHECQAEGTYDGGADS